MPLRLIKIQLHIMGCGSSQRDAGQPIRINTVTGRLKVTITSAHVGYQASVFKLDPYIILKLSNQSKQTKVVAKGDKQPTFMESFQFFVNSCFKIHGRNLELHLMDKKKIGSDHEVGFGIVDLDPVINFKKPKEQFRCFLSHNRENAGFVNIIAEFIQETSQPLSFRFETASIRRKTSTFGAMRCRVRVTIGEQVLMTTKQQDTKEAPPVWKDEVLTFNVAKSIKECQIQVLDDNQIIGSTTMTIQQLMNATGQQSFNQQFQFQDKVNAGSLKFHTIKGQNPKFSEIKVSHRKKKPEEDKRQEEPEGKKQDPNKKDQSKIQEKKNESKIQQPKKQQNKGDKSSEQNK